MLNKLIVLAREGTTEGRRDLFLMVSDLFVDGVERYSDREIVLFGEILAELIGRVELPDRIAVSRKIAPVRQTPRHVALMLVADEMPVAEPFLKYSPVLTDEDLVHIAGARSDEHRLAIAQRAALPETVTEALVDFGGIEVLRTVTGNAGARFSGRSTAILADRALADQQLAEAIARRTDLPPEMIDNVVRLINPSARRALTAIVRTEGEVDRVVDTVSTALSTMRDDLCRQRAETRLKVLDVQDGRCPLDDLLASLVADKRVLDIAYALSELAEVPEMHVSNALHKANATAIAVICKHLEVSTAHYAALTGLRAERLCLSQAQVDQTVREYREMSAGTADRALKFHQNRSALRVARR